MRPKNFVSAFSARLTSSQSNQLDSEVERQMAELLELLNASHICWFVIRRGTGNLVRVYSATKPGAPTPPEQIAPEDIPYGASRLMRGEKILLRRVGDLPPEAKQDRLFFRRHLVKSILLIPSNCETADRGVLGLAFSSWRKWPRDLVNQLEVLGNVIVAAVERKAAQEARQASERRFHDLFHQATTGIAIEDLDGHILLANPALCSILGYSQEELRNMTCDKFASVQDSQDDWRLFQKLRDRQINSYKIEKRYTRKDGVQVWGRLRVSLLKSGPAESPLVIAMVEDVTERKVAEEELRRAQAELQQLTARLMMAQDEERHRISRELHDDIGQRVALCAAGLADLKRTLSADRNDEARRHASDLLGQVSALATDIHQLSHRLHSSQLEHLGLGAALTELVAQLSRQHKISIDLKCDLPGGSIPSEVALCLFRVGQESLNNVIRHSRSQQASVEVISDKGTIQLITRDRGVGFDPADGPLGIGLVSMRERLRMVGGTLLIDSKPGKGTEIRAEVSLGQTLSAASSTAA
jgi:PAS domain S-box-containing protein